MIFEIKINDLFTTLPLLHSELHLSDSGKSLKFITRRTDGRTDMDTFCRRPVGTSGSRAARCTRRPSVRCWCLPQK